MDVALLRAEAYRRAGADAILIHSKLSKPDKFVTLAREWTRRSPLVIVPTCYYSTPADVFRDAGISTVIWANHPVRSAVFAMQSVAKEINDSQTLVNVEDRIVPVDEIFRLQDADEYSAAERQYLSAATLSRGAVVLAASRGRGLEAITMDRPKVMLPIAGKPLLRWLMDGFKMENINDITVVSGYRADAIDAAGIKLVVNERHAETGELTFLACAVGALDSDTVIPYGDLLERRADFSIVVDSLPTGASNRTERDFVYCSRCDDAGLFSTPVLLEHVTSGADPQREPQGRWIGMLNVSWRGLAKLTEVLAELRARPDFGALDMPALIAHGEIIEAQYVRGHWRGVNDLEDYRLAVDFAHAQTPYGSSLGVVRGES